MPGKETSYPADWLRIAVKDFSRVEKLLDIEDPEAAGFYLQQAVEKYFKAFLLSKGWKLKKTHDLETLLNEALEYYPTLEKYRSVCLKISGFYFLERYPIFSGAELTEEDIRDSLSKVRELIEKLIS